jgi:hypothetical protein
MVIHALEGLPIPKLLEAYDAPPTHAEAVVALKRVGMLPPTGQISPTIRPMRPQRPEPSVGSVEDE